MADPIRQIYDAMSERYDMAESYDDFAKGLSNPTARRSVYDAMSQHYEMDEWDAFDSTLAATLQPQTAPKPVNGNGTQPSAPRSQTQAMIADDQLLIDEVDRRLNEKLGIADIQPQAEPASTLDVEGGQPQPAPEPLTDVPKTEGDTGDLFGQGLQNLIRAGAGFFDYAQHLNRTAEKYGLDKSVTGDKYQAPDYGAVADSIRTAVDRMDVEQPTGKYAEPPEKLREYLTDPKRFVHLTATNAPTTAMLALETVVSPAAAVMTMNAIEGGQTAQTIREYEKATGRKLDTTQATLAPFVVGAINAALEKTGIDEILKSVKFKGPLKETISKVLFSALVEGGTEGTQEVNQILSEVLTDQGLDPQWADRIVANAVAGLGSGGGIAAGGATANAIYENTDEKIEARKRYNDYADKVRADMRQSVKDYLAKGKAEPTGQSRQPFTSMTAEEETALADEQAKMDAEEVLDWVQSDLTEIVGEEESPTTAQEAQGEAITPEAPTGIAGEEVAPTVTPEAKKPISALAAQEAIQKSKEIDVIPADIMEKERIAENLAEEEPIMALEADEIVQINADIERLGSVQEVVERYPSDSYQDRYARQRAERLYGEQEGPKESFANISVDRVEAKKRPDGQWQLFWRGTTNEIFPNELYPTATDARNAFKVQKARDQQAQTEPELVSDEPETRSTAEPVSAAPVSGTAETKQGTSDLILAGPEGKSPFVTKKAAQAFAKHKGKDYEAVAYGDKWAVRRTPTQTTPARELTAEERQLIDEQLDALERETQGYTVKPKRSTGMSIEGPEGEGRVIEESEGEPETKDEYQDLQFSTSSIKPAMDVPGIGALKVKQALIDIQPKLNIKVRVVGGVEDLEGNERQHVEEVLATGNVVDGFYNPNTGDIVVLGDAVASEDELLRLLLPHEIAHYGIEGVLGEKKYAKFLKELYDDPAIGPGIRKLMRKNKKWDQDEAAREWFARRAEGRNIEDTAEERTMWQRAMAILRRFFRMILGAKRVTFTHAEMDALLKQAFAYAQDMSKSPKLSSNPTMDTMLRKEAAHAEWYSQMQKVITDKLPGMGTVPGFRNTIQAWANKGEFKAEELQWSGLLDDPTSPLVAEKGKINRQEVIDWLEQNNVRVEEVRYGEPPNPDEVERLAEKLHQQAVNERVEELEDQGIEVTDDMRTDISNEISWGDYEDEAIEELSQSDVETFASYQLPGGENYRIVALTLPTKKGPSPADVQKIEELKKELAALEREIGQRQADLSYDSYSAIGKTKELKNEIIRLGNPPIQTGFKGGHLQADNVLVHLRLNDRIDADGKRVLFVEEVQSDWGEKGRRQGFAAPKTIKTANLRVDELRGGNWGVYAGDEFISGEYRTEAAAKSELARLQKQETYTIPADIAGKHPRAPFVTRTESWALLGMKKVIRIAAEGGYDRIAWTTGEQQAERYDLSKQVENIDYNKTERTNGQVIEGKYDLRVYSKGDGKLILDEQAVDLQFIKDNVGKEIAEKVQNSEGNNLGEGSYSLTGLDLKVGGEGMKSFYDVMLPNMVNKYVKKWGGRVGTAGIGTGEKLYDMTSRESGRMLARQFTEDEMNQAMSESPDKWIATLAKDNAATVHSLDITPSMRQSALMGQPLFRQLSSNDLLKQLQQVNKAIEELPAKRYGQPTGTLRQRLEAKAQELELQIVNRGGLQFRAEKPEGEAFENKVTPKARKAEGSRIDKRLDAMEARLPEKGLGELRKKHEATTIRAYMDALKQGHLMGQRDLKSAMDEVTGFIRNYAKRYLPGKGLTRGQVLPLLTAVAKAETADDMIAAYNRIDAISRTVTEKSLTAQINKLLDNYKPKKKQGKTYGPTLMAEGYDDINDIRGISLLTPDQIAQRKEFITQVAEGRNEGAQLGEQARQDYTPEEEEELYRLDLFGDLENADINRLQQAVDELKSLIDNSRTQRQERDEQWRERRGAERNMIVDVASDGKGVLSESRLAELEAKGEVKKHRIKGLLYSHLRLENLLDEFDKSSKSTRPYRGPLVRLVMPMLRAADNAEYDGASAQFLKISDKVAKVFGVDHLEGHERAKAISKHAQRMTKIQDTGIDVTEPDGTVVRLNLSQDQAAKKWMEWQDLSTASKFETMGWTAETMDALEAWLEPEVRELAEWQLYEWYPEYYKTVNPVFREMYNVDLPYNPLYSPIQVVHEGAFESENQMLTSSQNFYARTISDHLKNRTNNNRPLRLIGANGTLLKHMVEMEHFKAKAVAARKLRSWFSDEKVRASIRQSFGGRALARLDRYIDDWIRGGLDPKLNTSAFLDGLRKNFALSKLAFNLTMIPKQLVSFPAYMAEVPVVEWMRGMHEVILSPGEPLKMLSDSSYMRRRYGQGWDRDVMFNFQRNQAQLVAGLKNWRQRAMFPAKFGDAAAIAIGGWPVYKYHYKSALAGTGPYTKKHSEAEARSVAMEEFEASTARSQQSADIIDQPDIMRRDSLWRLFTMFQSAPNSYFNLVYNALTNLARGRGSKAENIKRLVIAQWILPLIWGVAEKGFRWDDEKELGALITGSLNGILFLGDLIERSTLGTIVALRGGSAFFLGGAVSNPVFELFGDDVPKIFERGARMVAKGDVTWEDTLKFLDDIAEATASMIGVPYSAPARMAKGIYKSIAERKLAQWQIVGYSEFSQRPTMAKKSKSKRSARSSERFGGERISEQRARRD